MTKGELNKIWRKRKTTEAYYKKDKYNINKYSECIVNNIWTGIIVQ